MGISQKNQRAAKHICLRFALGARGDVLDQPDLALAMRTIILDILKDFFRGTHGNETDALVQRAGEFFPPPLVMSMKAGSSLIFPSSSFRRVSAHEVGSALGDGLYSAGRGLDQF